jgi:hypothetical protein
VGNFTILHNIEYHGNKPTSAYVNKLSDQERQKRMDQL